MALLMTKIYKKRQYNKYGKAVVHHFPKKDPNTTFVKKPSFRMVNMELNIIGSYD